MTAEIHFEDRPTLVSDPITKSKGFSAALQLKGGVSMTSTC
jgi:hypothetical protein